MPARLASHRVLQSRLYQPNGHDSFLRAGYVAQSKCEARARPGALENRSQRALDVRFEMYPFYCSSERAYQAERAYQSRPYCSVKLPCKEEGKEVSFQG